MHSANQTEEMVSCAVSTPYLLLPLRPFHLLSEIGSRPQTRSAAMRVRSSGT
jgi:hypothetical protein